MLPMLERSGLAAEAGDAGDVGSVTVLKMYD